MEEHILALARDLEAADARLDEAIDDVERLQRETESLRRDAAEVAGRLAAAPEAQAAAADAVARAETDWVAARREASRAERAVVHAEERGSASDVAAARRALTQARDRAASVERKLERARRDLAEAEREAVEAARAMTSLEERAAVVGDGLASVGRRAPEAAGDRKPGLDGLVDWAARTRAALLVVRSGLDTERERVVREANELAAGVLGEPVAASVRDVRRRLERAG